MEQTGRTLGSEEALAQAAQLVCQALAAAPTPYAIVRLDGECVAVNGRFEAWAQPYGRAEGLVGSSLLTEDNDVFGRALARVSLGDIVTLDADCIPLLPERRGSYRVHLAPFRVGTMVCAAAVALQDLTEREQTREALRASELRFRALVESAGEGIAVHRSGVLLYANRAAVRLLGHESSGEVVGRPLVDFVDAEHRDRLRAQLAEVAHTGEATTREETFVRPDGTAVQLEVSASRATLEEGALAFVFLRDVTEQAQLREAAEQAGRMEALSRFAGSVAHDFNNLLAGIQGNLAMARLQLAQRDGLLAALDAAQREAERAADLTQQLQLFSRGADGASSAVDPNRVATEAVAVLERMGDGGCRIESELRAEVGQVFVGPAQLQQIVLNLLLNAREAVPVGGSISVHTEERNIEAEQASAHQRVGRWVVITVRDSGPGMDEATQARIFEPFFTTKRSGQGAGLGLSTVYGLVTQAGGWIDVRSGRGQGTTVSVHLPRLAEKAAQVESEPQHEQSARGETVLVCDDETRLATLTAGLLDQYGYGAVTAANVEEAVSALHAAEPACDVVLLDVNFPEGSALAMLEQMDQCGDRQPVILTSGYAEDDVPDELMSHANVVGYLAKPYSVDRLVGMMRRALGRRTSQL